MSQDASNNDAARPSGKNIVLSAVGGAAVAMIILFLFVLPAEYGVDPTGVGSALGLVQMTEEEAPAQPTKTVEIIDVIGGNETVRELEIPDFGEPVPLPNPQVHQDHEQAPRTDTVTLTLEPGAETEVKLVLRERQVVTYSWTTEGGGLYSDLHGHDPEAGSEFWVRYKEHQRPAEGHSGSIVAPFSGEHGWYWVNVGDTTVTVTLTVTGFYDDLIDYSELF